jgi:hypothetical protein
MVSNNQQLRVELRLRGEPPVLDRIRLGVAGHPSADTGRLQNRKLPKAVALIMAMFRAQPRLALFRVRMSEKGDCFVHTVLNAKNDTVHKSAIGALAATGLAGNESNRFLQLFLGPTGGKGARDYLEVDVARLQPEQVTIKWDGLEVSDPAQLKTIARKIAAQQHWELADYHFDIQPESAPPPFPAAGGASRRPHPHENGAVIKVDLARFSPELKPLELNFATLRNVGDLTNRVYLALGEFVEPYHYGHSWVLRDKKLGTVIKNRRLIDGLGTGHPVPDPRPLSEVGVSAATELEAIRLV